MCQGEGANLSLESDKEDDAGDGANRKVKFKIYSVKSHISIFSHSKQKNQIYFISTAINQKPLI